jgi:amino acid transporter
MKTWRNIALPSEDYVRKALPQVLSNTDMTWSFLMIMFFISNPIGTISAGAVSLLYWVVGAVVFFLPTVVAVSQLSVMFPHEGSTYTWTHKALGGFWSFFASVLFWVPGILATVGALSIALTFIQALHANWLTLPWQQGLALIVMIIVAGIIALQPARTIMNLVKITAPLTYGVVALLGIGAVIWLLTGHHSMTSFNTSQDWAVNVSNLPLFGAVILAYLGADVPIVMAGETKSGFHNPRTLFWGSIGVIAAYMILTIALMVVEGPQTATLGSFAVIDIITKMFGPIVGDVAIVCVLAFFPIFVALMSTIFARLLMTASIDRRLPISLSKLNKYRVPSRAVIFQTVISVIFALLLFLFPYVIPIANPQNLGAEIQSLSLSTLTLLWAISSGFLFIDLFIIYRRDPAWFHQHRIFSMPVLWFCMIVAPIASVVAFLVTLFFSQVPTLISNQQWLLYVLLLTAASLVISFIASVFATSDAAWQDQTYAAENSMQ